MSDRHAQDEAHDARLRQQYDLWKIAVQAYMDEMESVLGGQQGGGRLISTAASVEFAWDMLKRRLREAGRADDAAENAGEDGTRRGGDTDLYTPGPH